MPISGPSVHRQMMDAYNRLQAELQSAQSQLATAGEQRTQWIDHRGKRLVDLAKYYLPDLSDEAVQNLWGEVRPRIDAVVRRRDAIATEFTTRLTRLQQRREELDEQLVRAGETLTAMMQRQDELSDVTQQRLQDDQTFVELTDRAAKAEAALERAEANLDEIEQDAAKKLPAYEESTLFGYLRDRKFGTPAYKHRGFTRRMDRWVARLTKFSDAKRSYDFLRRTPDQMRQIIASDRTALDTVMTELERRRDDVAAASGLTTAIEDVNGAAADREQTMQSLAKIHQDIRDARDTLAEATDPTGPHYDEAIEVFRELLQTFDSEDLARRSQRTIDVTDDQIVRRLQDAEDQVVAIDRDTKQAATHLNTRREFHDALGAIIQRFRAAGFDSGRSQFVGSFDIVGEIDRGADNAIHQGLTEATTGLWSAIQKNQRWGPSLGEQISGVATHPMTQVLINAMAHAAGGALQQQARRAGRRHRRYRGGRSPFDSPFGGGSWGSGTWGRW